MSQVVQIPLQSITTSHNPRRPCPELQAALESEGYEDYSMLALIRELALSEDETKRAEFCHLIETYDGQDVNSIVQLANSRANVEIQPILLRDFRSKDGDGYVTRYGIVAGERRCIAAAYNHAKHGLPAQIEAQVKKLTVDEAYKLAVEENAQRLPMSDLEYGRIFRAYRSEENPQTKKNWSLKEVAASLHLDYQFVRGREALTYLPEADQRKLEVSGHQVNITKAIQKGLGLKRGKKTENLVDKKTIRQRTLNMAETQALFDKNRGACDSSAYLQALADVMQCSLSDAIAASDKRLSIRSAQVA